MTPTWWRTTSRSIRWSRVVNGQLDVAAIWGPFAGYYKTVKKAPLVIQPVNLMDDAVPMEFDMALAVRMRKPRPARQGRGGHEEGEGQDPRDPGRFRRAAGEMRVCLIDGDLPAHGPYAPAKPHPVTADTQGVTIAQLDEWLKHGAKVNDEFNNALIADDMVRVSYLLEKRHANINARDLQGYTPLLNAIRKTSLNMVKYLFAHKAMSTERTATGWTPVMTAAPGWMTATW